MITRQRRDHRSGRQRHARVLHSRSRFTGRGGGTAPSRAHYGSTTVAESARDELISLAKPGAASRGQLAPGHIMQFGPQLLCYVKTGRRQLRKKALIPAQFLPAGPPLTATGTRLDVSDFSMRRLHPLLQTQLRELRARVTGGRVSAHELLEMLSRYYDSVDDERRAMVRSMQLMSDEARSLGVEIAEQGAAQLQVILDHIKDVVITANVDGRDRSREPDDGARVRLSARGVVRTAHRRAGAVHRRRRLGHRGPRPARRQQRHLPRPARESRSLRAPQRRHAVPGGNCRQPRAPWPLRSLRDLPARHLRAAHDAGGAARQRGALPLAGGQRAGGDRRHRRGNAPLRRGERTRAAAVQDDARAAARLQRGGRERGVAGRRRAGRTRRIAST